MYICEKYKTMRYIANILTNKKIDSVEFYNIVSRKEDLIENLPTLVIGWEFTKTLYPNANIISWEIDENTYWTFGNRERRQKYEELLEKFNNLVIKKFIKKIKYKYISIIDGDINYPALEFLINECKGFKIYIDNNMIYATGKNSPERGNWVYGFSLEEYKYLGVDIKELFKKIYNSDIQIISSKDDISWKIKDSFKNCKYVIPCLF